MSRLARHGFRMKKKKEIIGVDPAFLDKQKDSLIRRNRKVIYFNDKEIAAIDEYCRRFRIKARTTMLREMIMEQILSDLDENHPTLF